MTCDDGELWCDNLYLCSLYFVLTTFTQNGVGDIMPKKHSEVVFVCALQIISTMVYMVYVGEFSNIIQYMSFRSFSFCTKYLELQEFLNNNRVSKNLVTMVNRYCLHLWRESRGMQAPHFLLTAPQALRLCVMSAAYIHHLTRHHVFEECEPAFLRQLVGFMQIYTYNEDMYVVKANEITNSMYLIHTGKVKEISEVSQQVSRVYPAGSYFGVTQGLYFDKPFKNSYQTLVQSQVLTLRLDDWMFLLKHFPASRETINKHLKHDDSNSTRSHSSGDSWPYYSPTPSKARVTELVDRGSQPTPTAEASSTPSPTTVPFMPPQGPMRDSIRESIPGEEKTDLWPKDSRREDTSSSSEQISVRLDSKKSKASLSAVSQSTIQTSNSQMSVRDKEASTSFLNKVTTKAKILMGKKPDTTLSSSNESSESQRDSLLKQEDELATTALIKAYDAKKKSSEKADVEFIEKDIVTKILGEIGSDANIIPEKKDEEEIASIVMKKSKSATSVTKEPDVEVDEKEEETSVILDLQIQTDGSKTIEKETSTVVPDTEDQATTTTKAIKRYVRVRYEEDDPNSNPLQSNELEGVKPTKDLTINERNILMQDSDMHVDKTPEPESDQATNSSTPSSTSTTSLKKKYNRPSS